MSNDTLGVSIDIAFMTLTMVMGEATTKERDELIIDDIVETIQDELKCTEEEARVKFEEVRERAISTLTEFGSVYDNDFTLETTGEDDE